MGQPLFRIKVIKKLLQVVINRATWHTSIGSRAKLKFSSHNTLFNQKRWLKMGIMGMKILT